MFKFKRQLKQPYKVIKPFSNEEFKEYFFLILGWQHLKDNIKVYLN